MPAERVVLIRHGQSEWNAAGRWQGQRGPGLSARGRRQAAKTATYLRARERDVRMLAGSDLARVTETAAPLVRGLGLELHEDARLREIDVGWWSGLTGDEVAARDPETLAAIRAGEDVPRGGGESERDLRSRVVQAVAELVAACNSGTLLIVSHGGPVRSVVGDVLGIPIGSQRALAGPGNCSRTVLTFDDGRARLRCYNGTAHLGRA